MLIELVDQLHREIVTLHPLIHTRKVYDVLRGILNHILGQRPLLPELVIVSHLRTYFSFLGISNIEVGQEKVVQRDIVVFVIHYLGGVVHGLTDDSVGDLSIEYIVAIYIELVDQS